MALSLFGRTLDGGGVVTPPKQPKPPTPPKVPVPKKPVLPAPVTPTASPAAAQPAPMAPQPAQPPAPSVQPWDPVANQIRGLKEMLAKVDEFMQQGRTDLASETIQLVKDIVLNSDDPRIRAEFMGYGGELYKADPGDFLNLNDIVRVGNALASQGPDMQALVANLQGQYLAQLEQLQQQVTAMFQAQLGGNDPAIQAIMDQITSAVQVQRQQLLEDMARRGLLQSGILLEMQDRLNRNELDARQQAAAQHYSTVLQQLNQAILSFAQQRLDAIQQFGLAGVNAALVQREQDIRRTLEMLNMSLQAQQFNQQARFQQQQFDWQRLIQQAQLTGQFNGQPTLDAQQLAMQRAADEYNRALALANALGYVPQSVANILGVPAGTKTADFLLSQQQLALQRAGLRASGAQGASTQDWVAFQSAVQSGDYNTAMMYATTKLGYKPNEANQLIMAMADNFASQQIQAIKAQTGLLSDAAAIFYNQFKNQPQTALQLLKTGGAADIIKQLVGDSNAVIPDVDAKRLQSLFNALIPSSKSTGQSWLQSLLQGIKQGASVAPPYGVPTTAPTWPIHPAVR